MTLNSSSVQQRMNLPTAAKLQAVMGLVTLTRGAQPAVGTGQIRSRGAATGLGGLVFGAVTFGLIHELEAATVPGDRLDDGTINYKDLKHGTYEIITHELIPRVIIIDDPGKTIILHHLGSGVSVEQISNTPAQMAQLQSAYQGALTTYTQGQQDQFIQQWEHAGEQPGTTGSSGGLPEPPSIGNAGGQNTTLRVVPRAPAEPLGRRQSGHRHDRNRGPWLDRPDASSYGL